MADRYVQNGQEITRAEYFKAFDLFWTIKTKQWDDGSSKWVDGPYCPKNCGYELSVARNMGGTFPTTVRCDRCSKQVKISQAPREMVPVVLKLFETEQRKDWPVTSLDTPPVDLKTKDEDENYWVAARLGIKNGKRIGVVYFGEKTNKQTKKDYAQAFLDIEDEQIRFDPGNKLPKELAVRFLAEFKDSDVLGNSKS